MFVGRILLKHKSPSYVSQVFQIRGNGFCLHVSWVPEETPSNVFTAESVFRELALDVFDIGRRMYIYPESSISSHKNFSYNYQESSLKVFCLMNSFELLSFNLDLKKKTLGLAHVTWAPVMVHFPIVSFRCWDGATLTSRWGLTALPVPLVHFYSSTSPTL